MVRGGRRTVVGCMAWFAPALAFAAATGGCTAPVEVSGAPDVRPEVSIVVAPNNLEIDFNFCEGLGDSGDPCGIDGAINIRFVNCSAKLSCEDRLLHDPDTLERSPTLVTGFSCGFPSTTPQDALLAYHPEIRCYTEGDLALRSSWRPVGGELFTPEDGEHLFFSSEAASKGDVYTNSAQLLRPLKAASADGLVGYGFCELTAWGTIAFANMSDDPRRAEHVPHSPAVEWRAIIEWTDNGWDCHLGEPSLTSVERVVLASATYGQAWPVSRGVLPASQSVVLLREEVLTGVSGINAQHPQMAAKLRYNDSSWFPVEPDDVPEPMSERQLWVLDPSQTMSPVPADIHIEKTCAEISPCPDPNLDEAECGVDAIGLLVSNSDHVTLGAIIVRPLIDGRPWDCDRITPTGACVLWNETDWDLIVPCLLPGAP